MPGQLDSAAAPRRKIDLDGGLILVPARFLLTGIPQRYPVLPQIVTELDAVAVSGIGAVAAPGFKAEQGFRRAIEKRADQPLILMVEAPPEASLPGSRGRAHQIAVDAHRSKRTPGGRDSGRSGWVWIGDHLFPLRRWKTIGFKAFRDFGGLLAGRLPTEVDHAIEAVFHGHDGVSRPGQFIEDQVSQAQVLITQIPNSVQGCIAAGRDAKAIAVLTPDVYKLKAAIPS